MGKTLENTKNKKAIITFVTIAYKVENQTAIVSFLCSYYYFN